MPCQTITLNLQEIMQNIKKNKVGKVTGPSGKWQTTGLEGCPPAT